ncbi:hypothetical protein HHK36_024892 [Tetracentron sinense]|uniref:Bet v I/Major latex protein domain-containing protein n=1 Tax=Tetracentron sinense TaxID=13715 RepID=A0A834YQU8_TETSI|nr:hypothetical protein HHK36_024892 [Tetracentron sinense]
MASTCKLEVEVEVKSSADKFWESIRDSTTLFPKIFPEQYKISRDGNYRILFFTGMPIVKVSKEKIDAVDEANKAVAYSVIEGDLLNFYKNFNANLQVTPKGDGSLVKWSCEFEKAREEVPDPNLIQEFAVKELPRLGCLSSQAIDGN